MANEENSTKHSHREFKGMRGSSASGAVYGMGLIGAAIYYIQHAATLLAGLIGILKAILWPAILIYKLLEFLKM